MAPDDVLRCSDRDRDWVTWAVRTVEADANRSADTHLIPLHLPEDFGVDLYLKDESTHPTGSLKHRLARSLFLYALCNGWIRRDSTVVEASSGSTAVSEAYFARLLGLPFVAVMPRTISAEKIALIERYGGRCDFVDDAGEVYARAQEVADETGGHYLDQFTYAERATDWRGNNNIAESIFDQMHLERHPVPAWVVVGAGTGGTSATVGRFLRYRGLPTKLCVVDPENSAFFGGWVDRDPHLVTGRGSRIEGIGRPRMEPSFQASVVDRMIRVSDAASIAAIHELRDRTGLFAGGSTGTNLYGALRLACEMRERGEQGSIVTLLCDGGDRYRHTYFDADWLATAGLDPAPYRDGLARAWDKGEWTWPAPNPEGARDFEASSTATRSDQ
ncbi:PLP-dependent cysteine synthase family protein [Calidifontibacter sp. DB0510]|uniref:L-cysteine desulfhydrase Cds1 n=1 Tax=Metallococcus carri TaxID=1656884 RepID=A0A967B7V7_9MICO|nr:PLP-dependent cysteine synthase family protein [Metallococcus carri]NHN56381.1 PLP-dependent cysteine synthase family protein [Metallococcus carri]NOP36005.1 PLP-dependent cysteine synthase family protein [Calidifontibacter sp. DB2511S]